LSRSLATRQTANHGAEASTATQIGSVPLSTRCKNSSGVLRLSLLHQYVIIAFYIGNMVWFVIVLVAELIAFFAQAVAYPGDKSKGADGGGGVSFSREPAALVRRRHADGFCGKVPVFSP
jgi:hypothetical protein